VKDALSSSAKCMSSRTIAGGVESPESILGTLIAWTVKT
jgi:hypothetical protein